MERQRLGHAVKGSQWHGSAWGPVRIRDSLTSNSLFKYLAKWRILFPICMVNANQQEYSE